MDIRFIYLTVFFVFSVTILFLYLIFNDRKSSSANTKNVTESDALKESLIKSGSVLTYKADFIVSDYKQAIDNIYSTLQMPRQNFDHTYLVFIKNVAFFIQSLPCTSNKKYNKSNGLLELCLLAGFNGVKLKRGFVLPPGTRTDIQDLQKSVWAFAIFTSVIYRIIENYILDCDVEVSKNNIDFEQWNLFELAPLGDFKYIRFKVSNKTDEQKNTISPFISSFLFNHLMPKESLNWLMEYDVVFREWCGLCTNNRDHIQWLRSFTDEQYFCPSEDINSKNKNIENVRSVSSDVKSNVSDSVDSSKNVSDLDSKNNDLVLSPKEISTIKTENKQPINIEEQMTLMSVEDSDLADSKMVDDFVSWFKTAYHEGNIILNKNDSIAHGVKSGIFICVPKVFLNYGNESGLDDNEIKELEVIIANSNNYGFVVSGSKTNLHSYDAYKNSIKGFILSFDLLDLFQKPPINIDLEVTPDEVEPIDAF